MIKPYDNDKTYEISGERLNLLYELTVELGGLCTACTNDIAKRISNDVGVGRLDFKEVGND